MHSDLTMKEKTSTSMQAYPMYDLAPSLEIGEAVHNCGGARVGVHKSQIAAHVKLSETSSTFDARMGTARSFGIITGRGEYTLTENAQKYFSPSSEEDRKQALLTFLVSPPVFAKFVDKYDGTKIPVGEFLANVFISQFQVGKSWAPRVATIFTKTAEMAGVLDSQGFLRYQAVVKGFASRVSLHGPGRTGVPPISPPSGTEGQVAQHISADSIATSHGTNVWVYSLSGKTVRLETPQDCPIQLWEKLNQYVQVVKPDEEPQE